MFWSRGDVVPRTRVLSCSCPESIFLPSIVQWETLQAVVNLAVRRSSFHNLVFKSKFTILQVHGRRSQSYEPLLLENEREAVADLLQYLESMEFELVVWIQSTNTVYRPDVNQLLHRISFSSTDNPLVFGQCGLAAERSPRFCRNYRKGGSPCWPRYPGSNSLPPQQP
jgi:hypothetical protein